MAQVHASTFGRYLIDERLAVGGMAELFRARVVGAHGFEKPVVLKRILPQLAADPAFVAMFIDEAKITARLDHPKIAHVFELGTIDAQLYIAMEYVDGCDLLAVLGHASQRRVRIPAPMAVHIAHEVLDALDYAHNFVDEKGLPLGIVHRDVSPSNVLLSWRGDVKLVDFGIARAMEVPHKTEAGVIKGKFHYMSPEQVGGALRLDGRSDLFAVGIVLAELLMGRRLFKAANDLELLGMVSEARTSRLDQYGADLDPVLRAVIDRALQKDPGARYQAAAEFRDALADWLFTRRVRVGPMDLSAYLHELFDDAASTAVSDPSGSRSLPSGSFRRPPTPPRAGVGEGPRRAANASGVSRIGAGAAARTGAEPAPPPVSTAPAMNDGTEAWAPAMPAVLSFDGLEEEEVAMVLEAELPSHPLDTTSPWAPPSIDGHPTAVTPDRGAPMPVVADEPPSQPRDSAAAEAFEMGDLSVTSPTALLHRMMQGCRTVELIFEQREQGSERHVYLVNGRITEVRSAMPSESLDAYLQDLGLITDIERSLAVAMAARFGENVAQTLVEQGVLEEARLNDPVKRHARGLLLDILGTREGRYRALAWQPSDRRVLSLSLDGMQLLGVAATALPEDYLVQWSSQRLDGLPRSTPGASTGARAFGFGENASRWCHHFNGRHALRDFLQSLREPLDRVRLLQMIHLLVETGLVALP